MRESAFELLAGCLSGAVLVTSKNGILHLGRCRELRHNSTDAERALWHRLRNRQLCGVKFRRQHRYGPYILDFFCFEHRLAIEVDGGQHMRDSRPARDAAKTHYLEEKGVRVLRFTNLEVLQESEAVLEAIRQAIELPSP